MKRQAIAAAISSPTVIGLSSAIGILSLFLFLLLWTFSSASGSPPVKTGDARGDTELSGEVSAIEDDAEVESVTMSIPLEEGGTIELNTPTSDVRIDTWEGEEVLVIVEKVKRSGSNNATTKPVEPINIKVTRHGKDVRIEATGGAGWQQNGIDLAFRILLPDRYRVESGSFPQGDTMDRLTSVLSRAVHREAIKWLVR